MRGIHQQNPFHKIQRWTGTHFRAAELWEVGTYVLVPHHEGDPLCDLLQFQKDHLERFERQKDALEQGNLLEKRPAPGSVPRNRQDVDDDEADMDIDDETDERTAEVAEDQEFEQFLNDLRRRENTNADNDEDPFDDREEDDDETLIAEAEGGLPVPDYLGADMNMPDVPTRDAFQNSYVRVVHTNGLHHLAMVSCRCRGAECLPRDLIACRLVPASFQNIRTLFSAQLLDFFRVCNLELKASAYSFYHLLRRLTMPMAPAEVANLYNEFRRMTRLWRWMKKLKWAGYGHNGKSTADIQAGELAIFCPACPQPGKNLPPDWKDDVNKYVLTHAICPAHGSICCRFAMRLDLAGDGNFSADHVSQNPPSNDYYLLDGGGIFPNRQEYLDFLKTAMERNTVCKV
jgi:hypothetical protein